MTTTAAEVDVKKAIAERIEKLYRERQRQPYGNRVPVTGDVEIGRFGNLVGATVSVKLEITVDTAVRPRAVVLCSGFGCVEPTHEVSAGDWIFGADHAQLTEPGRLKAYEWAQSHAERCRAMPGTTT